MVGAYKSIRSRWRIMITSQGCLREKGWLVTERDPRLGLGRAEIHVAGDVLVTAVPPVTPFLQNYSTERYLPNASRLLCLHSLFCLFDLSARDKVCYQGLGHQAVCPICIDIELSARDSGILFNKTWIQSQCISG
jgi:hypothetical protein